MLKILCYVLYCRYFSYIEECKNPKACTIVLRGAGKDFLMEVERNLQDAMNVARNVMVDARLTPGGGATEMAVAWVRELIASVMDCSCLLTIVSYCDYKHGLFFSQFQWKTIVQITP